MNTKLNNKNVLAKGFSLVEMLVVIAVIGIIAAIAIPSIGSISSSAAKARDQRNAQNIASVYATGNSAGVVWTTAPGATAASVVTTVTGGGTTPAPDSAYFGVDGLNTAAKASCTTYLTAGGAYNPGN